MLISWVSIDYFLCYFIYLFIYLFLAYLLIYLPTHVFITYLLLFVHCFTCLFFHKPTVLSSWCLTSTSSSLKPLRSAVKLKRWDSWRVQPQSFWTWGGVFKSPTSKLFHLWNFQVIHRHTFLLAPKQLVLWLVLLAATHLQRLLPLCHLSSLL